MGYQKEVGKALNTLRRTMTPKCLSRTVVLMITIMSSNLVVKRKQSTYQVRSRGEKIAIEAGLRLTNSHNGSGYGHGHSYSRSMSRSRSPRYPSGSRGRYRSRSNSLAPRRRAHYSVSPRRRPEDHSRTPFPVPCAQDGDYPRRRLYSRIC